MILDKDEFYKGLTGVDINSSETPPIVIDYMDYVSRTGLPLFDWQFLRPFILMRLEQEARSLYRESHNSHDDMEFESILQLCKERLNGFRGIPFTFQRICELLADVRSYYHRVDKFLRGFSKLIMVVSTVDLDGNKLVDYDDRPLISKEPSVPSSPSGSTRSNLNGSNVSPISPLLENGFTTSGRNKLWPNSIQAQFSPPSSPPLPMTINPASNGSLLGVRSPHPNAHNINTSRITSTSGPHINSFYTSSSSAPKRNTPGVTLRSPLTAFLEREEVETDVKEHDFQFDGGVKGQKDGSVVSSTTCGLISQPGFIQQDALEFSSGNILSHNFDSKDLRPIGRLEEIVEKMPSLVGSIPLDGHSYHLSPLKQDHRMEISSIMDTKKPSIPVVDSIKVSSLKEEKEKRSEPSTLDGPPLETSDVKDTTHATTSTVELVQETLPSMEVKTLAPPTENEYREEARVVEDKTANSNPGISLCNDIITTDMEPNDVSMEISSPVSLKRFLVNEEAANEREDKIGDFSDMDLSVVSEDSQNGSGIMLSPDVPAKRSRLEDSALESAPPSEILAVEATLPDESIQPRQEIEPNSETLN